MVKSRIQSGAHESITHCVRHLLKTDGVAAFGAGLQARCLRLFLSQAIQFSIVDALVLKMEKEAPKVAAVAPPLQELTSPSRHPPTLVPPARGA